MLVECSSEILFTEKSEFITYWFKLSRQLYPVSPDLTKIENSDTHFFLCLNSDVINTDYERFGCHQNYSYNLTQKIRKL